jgi:hypothetical protein
MKAARRNLSIARATAVGAVLCAVALPSPGQGVTRSRVGTFVANGGIPVVVDPAADLAAQVPGPETTWIDSIFIAGRVRSGGHNFGILIHVLAFPNADQRKLFISITDTSTGWYRNYAALVPKAGYTWSRKGLHIMMPGLTWTGSARRMQLKATTPWGSLKARFTPEGPVLNYSGIGLETELVGDRVAPGRLLRAGSRQAAGRRRRQVLDQPRHAQDLPHSLAHRHPGAPRSPQGRRQWPERAGISGRARRGRRGRHRPAPRAAT